MTWIVPVPTPVDGPQTGDDRAVVQGMLDWHRAGLLNICAGLTGEQLASKSVPSSDLSLLGLIRHLARVERVWLRQWAAGDPVAPLYPGAKNADFDDLDPASAEQDHHRLVEESRLADAAVAGLPLDHEFTVDGRVFSVRMAYLHLLAEYARHAGHADLLRETIDGVTGR